MSSDFIKVNHQTQGRQDRVYAIADAHPNCGCEAETMSPYSPGPVKPVETLVRLVCSPMHVHSKRPEIKPNFFAHAFSFGLSVQRLEHADYQELSQLAEGFLAPSEDRVWLGYVECPSNSLVNLRSSDSGNRLFCIYDTAEERNPAHAEIGISHRIPEADQAEYRRHLMRAFGDGAILDRQKMKDGAVWNQLPNNLRERRLPQQWTK